MFQCAYMHEITVSLLSKQQLYFLIIGVSSSISLSLTLSSSYDESTTNFLVSSHSPVELVCLFTGLASPFITWTHNNENLGDSYHEVWLKMNQWLPGNYCCSVNEVVTSSCISIHVISKFL